MSGLTSIVQQTYEQRAKALERSEKDPGFRSAIYEVCANDILFWINHFCWIYEPRQDQYTRLGYKDPHLLFITWEYQDRYIKWICERIDRGRDGLTEKSRDMGISWTVATVFVWYWLFRGSGNDFLIGSRKEEFVDKHGAYDAVFPKIRYLLYRLPGWMRPKGFNRARNDLYMRLINPDNGNYIKGEANNKFFGTGGRYKAVLLDEFSKWEHTDGLAWQSLSDATPCKLPVSSAFGRNNSFYEIRSGQLGDINVKRVHWKEHPLKDQKWYAREKKRRSPQDLAAEVDIDYTASITDKAYEAFNYNTHTDGNVYIDNHLPIILMCDFNIDPMCWCLGQEIKGTLYVFDELAEHSVDTGTCITKLIKRYEHHKKKEIHIYGDATGKRRDTRSKTSDYSIIKNILRANKWNVLSQVPLSNPPVKTRLNAVHKRLCDWENDNKAWIQINPDKCPVLVDSFEQTRRKDDGIDKKDNVDHMTDAIGYYITAEYPIVSRKVRSLQW